MTDSPAQPAGLAAVIAAAGEHARGPAPVHLWNPAHCGEIDILIRADGVWMHEGSPIGRPELVRLFSTVLRKDLDGYHLVTPGEKLKIRVKDLPFRAVRVDRIEGGDLAFTTDVGDVVVAGPEHPIRVGADPSGAPTPSVHVRGDLEARIARSVFYELVEMAGRDGDELRIQSGGEWWPLGRVEAA